MPRKVSVDSLLVVSICLVLFNFLSLLLTSVGDVPRIVKSRWVRSVRTKNEKVEKVEIFSPGRTDALLRGRPSVRVVKI